MLLTTCRTAIGEEQRLSQAVGSGSLDAVCESVETGTSQPSTRSEFSSAGREVHGSGEGSENVV